MLQRLNLLCIVGPS